MAEDNPELQNVNPKKDMLTVVGYWFWVLIFVTLGFAGLTAGRGLESEVNFSKFAIFTVIPIAFGGWILAVKLTQSMGFMKNFITIVHDTEYGLFGNFRVVSNPFLLFMLSLIVFSFLGFVGAISTLANPESSIGELIFPFTPGTVQQQVTPAGKLLFAVYAAPAENAWLFMVLQIFIFLELFTIGWLAKNVFNSSIQNNRKFWFVGFILPNALGAAWIWNRLHVLVTGAQQDQGLAHYFFGFNNALVTLVTGSIIPAEVYHVLNNLFFEISKSFGSLINVAAFGTVWFLAVVVFYLIVTKKSGVSD